jgi:predicted RNA-binding Zn-ribbon protein involved in translation (DUF1610 family)
MGVCIMYVCESCGSILKKTGAGMGLCPNCSRDSLAEKMLCPECGEEMDGPSEVEIMRQAWICRSCNIKVYKEHYE